MTVTVQIEPNIEARLLAEAHAKGIPIEAYIVNVITQVTAPEAPSEITLASFDAGLDELAEGSEQLPILPPQAYRRDSIYTEE